MTGPKRIATVALIARVIMAATTLLIVVAIIHVLYQAATGDMSGVARIVERDLIRPLVGWQIAVGALLLVISVAPLFYAFWSAHRFFLHFARAELFVGAMERTVRSLGWSLVLFWLLDWLANTAAIPLVTAYEPTGTELAIEFTIDETIALPIVGVILALIARALAEARRLDEDSKLIV